jgi:hypothetical protein
MFSYKTVQTAKALVVSPEGLARLLDALPVDKDKLRFTVECSDGTTLYPNSIEELLRFPNPKNREIQRIDISTPYQTESECAIHLSNDILGPATYTISGEDSYVVSTADVIEQHLESMNASGPHFISTSWALQDFGGLCCSPPPAS